MHETGTGQQMAQLHERLMMMMMINSICNCIYLCRHILFSTYLRNWIFEHHVAFILIDVRFSQVQRYRHMWIYAVQLVQPYIIGQACDVTNCCASVILSRYFYFSQNILLWIIQLKCIARSSVACFSDDGLELHSNILIRMWQYYCSDCNIQFFVEKLIIRNTLYNKLNTFFICFSMTPIQWKTSL